MHFQAFGGNLRNKPLTTRLRGGGIFDPRGQATHAEFAAMLMRFIEAQAGNGLVQTTTSNAVDAYIDRRAQEEIERTWRFPLSGDS